MALRMDATDGWEHRVDRGELLSCVERPDGTLLVEGYAAKAGILEYRTPKGVVRELIRADTLKRAARGMARTVVTLEHPDPQRYPDMVTPENVHELQVGDTDGEVEIHDGGFVKVRMAIRRRDAIQAVRNGTQELSHGYGVRIDATPGADPAYAYPGNPEGRWDQEQVERAGNHIAITERARAGREVRLRADAAVATTVISGTPPVSTQSQGQQRARGATVNPLLLQALHDLDVRVDGVSTDEAAIALLARVTHERAGSRADAEKTHKAALDAMTAERDAAKARADKAEAEVKALKDAEAARADKADRERLDGIATRLGIDPKAHADSKALRRAIASKHLGSEVRADASDDYVAALVDLAAASGAQRSDGREAGRQVWDAPPPARQDGQEPPARQDGTPKRRPTANEQRLQQIEAARKARQ